MNSTTFLLPWRPVRQAEANLLLKELALEMMEGHPFLGIELGAVARSAANDDVLFRLQDGRFAVVHLTWRGKAERPPWRLTVFIPISRIGQKL